MTHLARHLSPNRRRDRALAGVGVLLMVGAASVGSAGAAAAAETITICHATNSNENPYIVNSPDRTGDVSGHADHTGPLWNPTLKDSHTSWGDIIPPFTYYVNGEPMSYPGLNYDVFGALFIAQGCNIPIPDLTATLVKENDANGDGTYSATETATAAGLPVPFRITVTNTSIVPVTITSLTDTLAGAALLPTCDPSIVGTIVQPGDSATCAFTLPAYSPAAGTSAVNLATVILAQAAGPNLPAEPNNTLTLTKRSTVITPALIVPTTPPPTTPPPTTPPPTTPPPTTPPPTTAPPTTPPATTPPPTTPPPAAADLAIVKTGPATAVPGDTITWTLTVTNTGGVTADGVTVTDALPDGVAFISAAGLGWSCSNTTTLTCTDSLPLAAGASSAITVVGTLGSAFTGATLTNTAALTPSDATPADDTSSLTTTVSVPVVGISNPGAVAAPGTPAVGNGGGPVTLPRTGAPIGILMLAGQALFAFGGLMLMLGRRRQA